MSGTAESIRRKIGAAGEIHSVVRSMKALAASSVGQYEEAVRALDGYYRTVELGLAACIRQAGSPVLSRRKPEPPALGAVVFGSDQGLVGRFNEGLAEYAIQTLGKLPGKPAKIWAVGERIHELIADAGPTPDDVSSLPSSVHGIAPLIGRMIVQIEEARERGEVIDVYLFHNRPTTGAAYGPVSRRLLPLDQVWQSKLAALPWPTKNLPEVIEESAPALRAFVREYLFVLLFRACAESLASENASRLAAMQRAEKNIEELLDELNGTFHRIRQESIDEELFDVISGYEALSKGARTSRPPATANARTK